MAGFLDSMAGNLLGRIIGAAGRPEFCHIRSELRNLETTVSNLKSGLRDAEEKQASDAELYDLLKQLKHAFSMADDLLEVLECDYLKWRVQNRKNDVDKKGCQFFSCFSSNFLVSATKTAAEINEITKTLDTIEETLSEFSLVEDENEHIKRLKSEMSLRSSITGSQVFSRLLHLKKEAILSDNFDYIVGRDEAKQSIIDELLKDEDDEQKSRRILSIHGDGGMGKTALAKLVYNDNEVFDHFDKRMWIWVSEDFDVRRIRREVLSSATGEKVSDVLSDCRLLIRLKRNFIGRKFLLVLDDFGDLDSGRVSELEKLVEMGANGSKIMITTRSEQTVQDSATYKVEKLDEEKSMVLFEQTFGRKILTGNMTRIHSELKKELVPKCGGVPLAIKSLAGLLSLEASYGVEWLDVTAFSEKWKQEEVKEGGCVLHALKLSYDLMPSYLKPCFLCFSLLPKDYVFYSFEIIQLWMAQGILHSDSKDPEVVGEQYFNELWSRGLLEDVEEHALGYWFKIHSLVHDLAVQQASKEQQNLESLHQLSFVNCNNKDLPRPTCDKICVLSIPVGGGVEPKINGVPLFKCLTNFRQLRVLYLCNSSLEEIPTSIDALKHLRYLDLRGSRRLKRLPESICKLQSLQTLILAFCSELEELPKDIGNLISLRFLWIQTKQASLGKDGIGSLTSLRFLAIGGSKSLTRLFDDIDRLNSLQTLIIYDCKSLLTLPKGLESLSTLCNMALWGCEQLKWTISLELLRLKKLILRGLPSFAIFPTWLNRFDADLEVLEVGEFPTLRVLPSWLPNLWELRILGISNCPRLEGRMPLYMDNCDKMEELRITFCGMFSKNVMNESNHEEWGISHVSTIYVDTRRTNPRVTSIDEHEAAGGAEVKHGVDNDEQESDAQHVGFNNDAGVRPKQDGIGSDIHESIGTRQVNGAAEDGRVGAGQTGQGEHNRTTNDDHLEANIGSDIGTGRPLNPEHDKANNDSHVGTGQTVGEKVDEVGDDRLVGTEQTLGDPNVGTRHIVRAKQDVITDESHAGAKLGGANENGDAEVDRAGSEQTMVITVEGF
ncbi:putative disease resistance protein RGA1 [Cucurbita maxima]|uniref:Disease resistance protein RGA1 n=1 Tax=Cucurbita maxima TaxID=3661 RepID=A0A6J1J8G0_CUCMA|nr:putative disease resistance protein RGA1 [Cucurbita maxima]